MIKKIIVYGFLIFITYVGLKYYSAYTLAIKLPSCADMQKFKQFDSSEKNSIKREDYLLMAKTYRCLETKQNFLEKWYFSFPKEWSNPSRQYVDPPFTEAELNANTTAIDADIKKDGQHLARIFSSDFVSETTQMLPDANFTVSDSEERKISVQHTIVAVKKLIENLRNFNPDSTEVMILKTRLVYSLDQLKLAYEDGLGLYEKASVSMAEGEALLAKPQSELKLHRDELLRLKYEMNDYELKFRSIQLKVSEIEKDLTQAADELNRLLQVNQ
ncbi:hypothetical protein [Methylotenera sp.]|uniref:hypothetical protein n=1 Tax=Methylotenera sp. TaxID=2051956 RepID=UPI002489F797|nr:hypothetical protein [Methylotenera sp.]MDI1299867.1 hypothetical protein [Methylotenera sp.]